MDDIFSQFGDMFGNFGGRQQRRQARGMELRMKVTLNINEILNGCTKKLKYKRQNTCGSCNGQGGTDVRTCIPCNGHGQRVVVQNTPFGQMRTQTICPDCQGSGQQIANKCGVCHGEGTTLQDQTVDVEIPAGVSTGMQMNMAGYGNAVKNGVPGDLHIIIEEQQDFTFKREGNNIVVEKEISLIDAVCGLHTEVKTPRGDIRIFVQEGTEHGHMIRIGGKGIPDIHHGLGDLFVKVLIKIPKNITMDERHTLEKLRDLNCFK